MESALSFGRRFQRLSRTCGQRPFHQAQQFRTSQSHFHRRLRCGWIHILLRNHFGEQKGQGKQILQPSAGNDSELLSAEIAAAEKLLISWNRSFSALFFQFSVIVFSLTKPGVSVVQSWCQCRWLPRSQTWPQKLPSILRTGSVNFRPNVSFPT